MPARPTSVTVRVELGGGLEALFGGVKAWPALVVPAADVRGLLAHLADALLRGPRALFLPADAAARGGRPRPGILVLVNDADCELDGGPDAPLADGDTVLIVSTLHGG